MEDYFGLPTGVSNLSVSALWHRAYNLIYNEWFRDENLQDSVPVLKNDGQTLLQIISFFAAVSVMIILPLAFPGLRKDQA